MGLLHDEVMSLRHGSAKKLRDETTRKIVRTGSGARQWLFNSIKIPPPPDNQICRQRQRWAMSIVTNIQGLPTYDTIVVVPVVRKSKKGQEIS